MALPSVEDGASRCQRVTSAPFRQRQRDM